MTQPGMMVKDNGDSRHFGEEDKAKSKCGDSGCARMTAVGWLARANG
jgi:hypothetical protein